MHRKIAWRICSSIKFFYFILFILPSTFSTYPKSQRLVLNLRYSFVFITVNVIQLLSHKSFFLVPISSMLTANFSVEHEIDEDFKITLPKNSLWRIWMLVVDFNVLFAHSLAPTRCMCFCYFSSAFTHSIDRLATFYLTKAGINIWTSLKSVLHAIRIRSMMIFRIVI